LHDLRLVGGRHRRQHPRRLHARCFRREPGLVLGARSACGRCLRGRPSAHASARLGRRSRFFGHRSPRLSIRHTRDRCAYLRPIGPLDEVLSAHLNGRSRGHPRGWPGERRSEADLQTTQGPGLLSPGESGNPIVARGPSYSATRVSVRPRRTSSTPPSAQRTPPALGRCPSRTTKRCGSRATATRGRLDPSSRSVSARILEGVSMKRLGSVRKPKAQERPNSSRSPRFWPVRSLSLSRRALVWLVAHPLASRREGEDATGTRARARRRDASPAA
jgi:hypothetical protein